uniref:Leucine-rich repeat-containing N-terminal plant-type domain-containing protein n=1 Tax=Pseudictyota dubia TaxID=2749911 RepID=A0A7R9ZDB3_9STRA|mmetsp:Transcript_42271/g.78258  ORF Transcript_42271/g.78258 Transcript_42271/m.78258 type:complete len:559 (+) Transcript_42271:53-1729(+)
MSNQVPSSSKPTPTSSKPARVEVLEGVPPQGPPSNTMLSSTKKRQVHFPEVAPNQGPPGDITAGRARSGAAPTRFAAAGTAKAAALERRNHRYSSVAAAGTKRRDARLPRTIAATTSTPAGAEGLTDAEGIQPASGGQTIGGTPDRELGPSTSQLSLEHPMQDGTFSPFSTSTNSNRANQMTRDTVDDRDEGFIATAKVVEDSGLEEEVQRLKLENEILRRTQVIPEHITNSAIVSAQFIQVEPTSGTHTEGNAKGEEGETEAGDVQHKETGVRACLSRRKVVAAVLIVIFVVAVAAVVAKRNSGGNNNNDSASNTPQPTPMPSNAPTNDAEDALRAKICTGVPSTCADLSTEGTPQWKAFAWVTLDSKFEEYQEWRRVQRYALATIAYSLKGWGAGDVVDWMDGSSDDECSWVWGSVAHSDTIGCNSLGRVTRIGFDNNLVAKNQLPRDVALLSSSLDELHFAWVGFQGTIPTDLGMLSNLRELYLSGNNFSGTIPTEFGELSLLEKLGLEKNDGLSGAVPAELCGLPEYSPGGVMRYIWVDCAFECDCCGNTWCYR